MLYTERRGLPEKEHPPSTTLAGRNTARRYVCEFPAAQIKEALIPDLELTCPLDEMIATGEAAFEFIRHSSMELSTKNAFNQLEKQFAFYKNLLAL